MMHLFERLNVIPPDGAELSSVETADGSARLRTLHRPSRIPDRDVGAEQRVIGIPGIPTLLGDWIPFVCAVAPRFDVHVIERAGYGDSSGAGASAEMEDQLGAVTPLLPPRGAPKALIVGHSYGTLIALFAALAYPERIAGVLAISGPSDPETFPAALGGVFGGAAEAALGWSAQFFPHWIMRATAIDASGVRDHLATLQAHIGDLKVPVALMHGDHDTVVPYRQMAHRAGLIPDGLLAGETTLAGARHNLVRSHGAECARALDALAAFSAG